MQWASAVSVNPSLDGAVKDAAQLLRSQLGDVRPDLNIAFVSAQHREQFERVPALVAAELPGLLIGCTAGGVIGGNREIEQQPGLSLVGAALPDVDVIPIRGELGSMPAATDPPAEWERRLGVAAAQEPHFVLLPDPFRFDSEAFLSALDRVYPGSRKVGGLASGGGQPGANALYLGRGTYRAGLVGVALTGNVQVQTIVAQGCRPIGQPMFITKCQENILWELDGQPAVSTLQELYERLDSGDQELARHSLFLGIVMKEDRHEYRQGDFLIRNIIGMDAARGVLAIGARLRDNSVVQFHLRDAKTSADDLEQMLTGFAAAHPIRPQGALLFSCLGRGAFLYGRPDHDSEAFRRHLGAIPLGGFFCNGEIGPVHGSTFLHGYTSAFGLFSSRD